MLDVQQNEKKNSIETVNRGGPQMESVNGRVNGHLEGFVKLELPDAIEEFHASIDMWIKKQHPRQLHDCNAL